MLNRWWIMTNNYKIVCRAPDGQIVLSSENMTLEDAEIHAAMFNENNHTMGVPNLWTVEPMRWQ